MRRTMIMLAVLGLGLAAACNDDATTPGTDFDLTVGVVDTEGNRVEGLELMVVMDSPYYQDGLSAAKAAVSIRLSVPVTSPVTVTVEDAAGGLVRTLVTDTLRAGAHEVQWNGRDDDDMPRYSGLYYAHMVARDESGQIGHDERQPMYMALIDFDRATLGTTDVNGQIELKDKRLFPALYGEVDMHARDENGDDMGVFPVTHTMRFYLRHPGAGHAETYYREVTRSGETLVLEWTGIAPAAPGPGSGPVAGAPSGAGDPPNAVFRLWPPYPNPFN